MPKARPRYYLVPRRGSGWYVVSCYAEEDVVECICDTEQAANDAIPKVRAFREDQNEAPRIVVEHHA